MDTPPGPVSLINLQGRRVVITQSGEFMGPALCEVFAAAGADVIADTTRLIEPDAPAQLVARARCW